MQYEEMSALEIDDTAVEYMQLYLSHFQLYKFAVEVFYADQLSWKKDEIQMTLLSYCTAILELGMRKGGQHGERSHVDGDQTTWTWEVLQRP